MEIREIDNKEIWENFLLQCAEKTFLQSWSWGEFSKAMGDNVWRFGAYYEEKLIGVAQVIKISAMRGTFLFIPHGPVLIEGLDAKDKKEILQLLLLQINDIAKKENPSFIRIAPIFEGNEQNENIFEELNFTTAPIHMHPEATWELNITLSEEELLAGMRKTTRYLIRQAEKNPDIEITQSNDSKDLELFLPVYYETAKRHKFVVFSEKYLRTQFDIFSKDKEILLFFGKYKSEVVSAAIFIFWQDICFYHHSGSLSKYNKIPVSYLLQWGAIKEAKNRGCKSYNFWGIAPDIKDETDAARSKHPWAGLSLFKMGFGGQRKKYVKTQDFILSKIYWLNYIIEKARKFKRNL